MLAPAFFLAPQDPQFFIPESPLVLPSSKRHEEDKYIS